MIKNAETFFQLRKDNYLRKLKGKKPLLSDKISISHLRRYLTLLYIIFYQNFVPMALFLAS